MCNNLVQNGTQTSYFLLIDKVWKVGMGINIYQTSQVCYTRVGVNIGKPPWSSNSVPNEM